jgi:hypothetical protein
MVFDVKRLTQGTWIGEFTGGKETMFETVFFLECPGMSQPLDSAMRARPPKVPFFWWERYVFVILGEKNCACGQLPYIRYVHMQKNKKIGWI